MADKSGTMDILNDALRQVRDGFEEPTIESNRHMRGGTTDPITSERWRRPRRVEPDEAWDLYETNWLARNAVDALAEDLIGAGFQVKIKDDDDLAAEVNKQIEALGLRDDLLELVRFALIEGDGFDSLGVATGAKPANGEVAKPSVASQPVDIKAVTGIVYSHPFPGSYVQEMKRNDNPFSEKFGEWDSYDVVPPQGPGDEKVEKQSVHASRVLHLQPFPEHGEERGLSYFQSWMDVLHIVDKATWSIALLVGKLTFMTLNLDMGEFKKEAERDGITPYELMMRITRLMNSLSVFVLEKGNSVTGIMPDSVNFPTMASGASAISVVSEFMWQLASGATRTPRTRLIGNEAGHLTGAEWDGKNYYTAIKRRQRTWLHPLVDKVVKYLLAAAGKDPAEVEYEIEFTDPTPEDALGEVQRRLVEAQIDGEYLSSQVITPDEVRKERLGKDPLKNRLVAPIPQMPGLPGQPTPPQGQGEERQAGAVETGVEGAKPGEETAPRE